MTSIKLRGYRKTAKYFGQMSKMQEEIRKLTAQQAEEAKEFARSIAPVYTGALVSAIETNINKKNEYTIVSRTPSRNNPKRLPYQVWMHGNGGKDISAHIKSGDPRYMDTTYSHLKKRYPIRVERALDKQIKK